MADAGSLLRRGIDMTKSVDWAVNKNPPKGEGGSSEGGSPKKVGAGKGDAPRHSIRRFDQGYDMIKWGKK